MVLILVGLGVLPGRVAAQEASATAAVGAGVFGTEAAAAAQVGIDVSGSAYAMGLGARLRWVAADGLRTEDWDEPSEWAAVLRYLLYSRTPAHGTAVSAAVGALGNVDLGQGALIRGYTTGLDVDHHRVGAQVRIAGAGWGVEGLVDDLVAPRIAGARAAWQRSASGHGLEAGLSLAADFSAPERMGTATAILPMAALDGRAQMHTADQRLAGAVHADLVAIGAVAGGLHLGASAEAGLADARVAARAELQVGTDGYLGGWIGPLYDRDRRARDGMDTQLDVARTGGRGRVGSLFTAGGSHPGLGEASLSYARRPGLPDLAVARAVAPHRHHAQGALWAAIERGGSGRALALELRAVLPRGLFVTLEAARLYRTQDGILAPWWLATASLGAALSLSGAAAPHP